MKVNRRNFMRAAGTLAVASVAQRLPVFTQQAEPGARVAVLQDPAFPSGEIPLAKESIAGSLGAFDLQFLDPDGLNAHLDVRSHDLLLNPYGSFFPRQSWAVILKYLREGGNLVNLGGVPFSIPVDREGGAWRPATSQTQYHKILGITQAFRVDGSTTYRSVDDVRLEFSAEEIYELYFRFTETVDFPGESGSAGARDAAIHPLVYGLSANGRRISAPVIQIDRLQGDCSGGRWLLANFKGTLSAASIRTIVDIALQGSMDFSAHPLYACYHEGEQPSFRVQFRRPKGDAGALMSGDCRLEILDERNRTVEKLRTRLQGGNTLLSGSAELKRNSLAPGLYQINVSQNLGSPSSDSGRTLTASTGFWVLDRKLLEGGPSLGVGGDLFTRGEKPFPVTGTTYMGSDVHRKFLFEPDPHRWDRDFSEMKSAGVNMVRTGIWTGWRNYMLDVGAPDESALRAMDAFLLTARRHDIPVVFTFFSFLPETWGGLNAYLDPRSVSAQQEFVSIFAQRYKRVKGIVWDLINEPSFCNPQHLWSCRPNYDRYEELAWTAWLKERYPAGSDAEQTARLQELYRETASGAIPLPALEEFSDANVFNEFHPIKVIDYRLFAQEKFAQWVKKMAGAIRANGNPDQLVTVGQDEAGTGDSPNPHFFGDNIDFTCVHNWWLNDDLVWDNVITKPPGKLNLTEETGVMFYEKMDGSPWRSEGEAEKLLERKLATSFGAGGAGSIEWVWNTNPFIKSDNEAAIGFLRVDGTSKPELEPFARFSKFLSGNSHLMIGRKPEEVVMVIPHSQMYSVRNFATEATRRCVRAMYYHCTMALSAVSEYRMDSLRTPPKLIVVPSPRTLNEPAWKRLLELAERGSTIMISGPFDEDDHSLPAPRSLQLGFKASAAPVAQEEFMKIDGVEYQLSYRGDKLERIEKAIIPEQQPEVLTVARGTGKIIWSPLPVELAEDIKPSVALYAYALGQSNCDPGFATDKRDSSILVLPSVFRDAVLYTCVSENARDAEVRITHHETGTTFAVKVPGQRTAMVFLNRKDGKVISQLA